MKRMTAALLGSTALFVSGAVFAASGGLQIQADDIGGVVRGPSGPEAGVWVIAETDELPTRLIKVVVTDDQGRYLLPDLPDATYSVWVRGYGLVDSDPANAEPGATLNLTAVKAPSEAEAAQYYPANYWFSLIEVPDKSEFPGTGPSGNGINPRFKTQQDWLGHLKESCQFCHQLGTRATRELADIGDSIEAWDQRVQKERDADDMYRGDLAKARINGRIMSNNMTQFGRRRGLEMFADWTNRIADGAIPKEAPERPSGLERNLVLTIWDWADGLFLHDMSVSDKRNPTVNAGGRVFGVANHSGVVASLQPETGETDLHKINGLSGEWNMNMNNHTSTMDEKGRYWMSNTGATEGPNHEFCTDGRLSPYAANFPSPGRGGRFVTVFDPATGDSEATPVCFGSHHLNFTHQGSKLFFSGDTQVVGWIDTKVWDETKDAAKSIGWCPTVIDTNGDGKITPDRTQWNEITTGGDGGEGAVASSESEVGEIDPSKDTRITGFHYGMGMSPVDDSYWVAKYSPTVPSGILRVDIGSNPPETCKTEYYEVPMGDDGSYEAFNTRGVDVDAEGRAWVAFGTGQIAKFDRSKCDVLNGPTATGQHCEAGWELYDTPGPKLQGTDVGSDYFYLTWVDLHNTLGLGRNVPIFPGSSSDMLLAFLPDEEEMLELRVPYPMGFYTRGIDGRVDNEKIGWKGRGLWATYSNQPPWHLEGGEGEYLKMVKFQLRPDPLSN